MSAFVRTSPHLFRPLRAAVVVCVAALMLGALLVPAPLEIAADPGHPPNPARSAWFLLWIQELVSHSTAGVYIVFALALALIAAPWWPAPRPEHARWFPPRCWPIALMTLAAAGAVVALTLVAAWFRGPNWQFIAPF